MSSIRLLPALAAASIFSAAYVGVAQSAPSGEPQFAEDGRQTLFLTPEQKAHVSQEMRMFLAGVQGLTQSIANEDRSEIADIAHSLGPTGPGGGMGQGRGQGRGMGHGAGQGMGGGMNGIMANQPAQFHEYGRSLRQGFKAIGHMADTASMKDIQQALADNLINCSSCHATFAAQDAPQ